MSKGDESANQREPGRYVGAMMRVVWQWIRQEIYAGVIEAGYGDLNPAHVGMFRYPSSEGLRPSELADKVNITKQSVNDLLGHLERCGYLTREPDPADGRARVIRLTDKGHELEWVINGLAEGAERRIADHLGPKRFAQFRSSLEDVTDHLATG
jgi:DNA-binding MarR family transcriptional regulator